MFTRSHVTNDLLAVVAAISLAVAQPALTQASTWKHLSPTTSAAARSYPAMAYDPVSKKVVLFGGIGQTGNLNDTWTFDGTTWTQVKTAAAPSARNGASMAFDRRTNKIVLFGGFAGTTKFLNDTWLWDGATSTWTRVQMKPSPPRATGAMLFTDPLSGRAMMFGGYNRLHPIKVYSTTWRWTGTSWHKMHPGTLPYPRAWGVATTDPVRKNTVLTGGDGDTIRTDNTWTWDGHNWTQEFPATQIQKLVGAGSTFDPAVQTVVVFGGFAGIEVNQTWSWTGTNWVQMQPTKSPSAREGVAMAYDPATHQTLIFGGQDSNGTVLSDTWQLVGR